MNSSSRTRFHDLKPDVRARLMELGHEVGYPAGARLFRERAQANRFWILRTGSVALELHVPGRRPAVIETAGPSSLVGLSWLYPPHSWQLGAEATTPLRAHEFDAATVRATMAADPALASAISAWVGQLLAQRLRAARVRLLDLYAPYGSGTSLNDAAT